MPPIKRPHFGSESACCYRCSLRQCRELADIAQEARSSLIWSAAISSPIRATTYRLAGAACVLPRDRKNEKERETVMGAINVESDDDPDDTPTSSSGNPSVSTRSGGSRAGDKLLISTSVVIVLVIIAWLAN